MRHSCGTQLREHSVGDFVGHSCGTLFWDTRVATRFAHTRSSHASFACFLQKSRSEAARRSFRARLPPEVTRQVPKMERFPRDLLQKKSHVKSRKRAFCTRLPPKVTCQLSKTSVSCETSSKHSRVKVSKTSVLHPSSLSPVPVPSSLSPVCCPQFPAKFPVPVPCPQLSDR